MQEVVTRIEEFKEKSNVDAYIIADRKGFELYNQGFGHHYHLHALKQLSSYFFPKEEGTIVAVDTDQFTVTMKDTSEGNMLAYRELK